MFIAALFTRGKTWKHLAFPSVDEWTNKVQYTMGYSSVFKRQEILTHAATWVNTEDIVLNETSQSLKTNTV